MCVSCGDVGVETPFPSTEIPQKPSDLGIKLGIPTSPSILLPLLYNKTHKSTFTYPPLNLRLQPIVYIS